MERSKDSKLGALLKLLKSYGSVVVAYSGGVDSTFLLAAAKKALGNNVLAVTARSPIHPKEDLNFAKAMGEQLGVRHVVVDTEEMKDPEFLKNTKERCYYCKRDMFTKILKVAEEEGISHVLHGLTIDDLSDHRPGIRAT
ncbi:MAG: argininosuccinate synthase domain-containing protein, partial [Desulfatiglandales bacterium]